MKILPRDQWGRIPAIVFKGWSIVWSWPRGEMLWFMWGFGVGLYRIGPLTVHIQRPNNHSPISEAVRRLP